MSRAIQITQKRDEKEIHLRDYLIKVPCEEENCMAWVPECEEVEHRSCQEEIEICEKMYQGRNSCYAHCKLIER